MKALKHLFYLCKKTFKEDPSEFVWHIAMPLLTACGGIPLSPPFGEQIYMKTLLRKFFRAAVFRTTCRLKRNCRILRASFYNAHGSFCRKPHILSFCAGEK